MKCSCDVAIESVEELEKIVQNENDIKFDFSQIEELVKKNKFW